MTATVRPITDHPRFQRVRAAALTKKQLSATIGFSERWIELRHKDGLPVHRQPNNEARYFLSEVEAFVAEWIERRG